MARLDIWETTEASFRFEDGFAIPPGLICEGAAGFTGTVEFVGVPMQSLQDPEDPRKVYAADDLGTADTAVWRKGPMVFDANGMATVDLEVVKLSLVSKYQLAIDVGGETRLWSVAIELSAENGEALAVRLGRAPSTMTVHRRGPDGGVYSARLHVVPRFIFTPMTREGDARQRPLPAKARRPPIDVGTLLANGVLAPERLDDIQLTGHGLAWTTTPAPDTLHIADVSDDPEHPEPAFFACTLIPQFELAAYARHGVICARKRGKQGGLVLGRPFEYEYAVKLVAGLQPHPHGMTLTRGFYATSINIHNPNPHTVRIYKKLALTAPPAWERPGAIHPIALDDLGPDGAFKVDGDQIRAQFFPKGLPQPGFIEGFVIIQCDDSLDVYGVYTAAVLDAHGHVTEQSGVDVVQVHERKRGVPAVSPAAPLRRRRRM